MINYIYTCTSNEQCGLDSFCIDNVCKEMETCRSDEDCPYSRICGAFNGKKSCLKLYSYSDGDNVDRGNLCKSGFFGYNQEKREYQCASATISNDTCDEVHQCEYEYTIDKYKGKTKVNCVTDNEGVYHCPPTTDSKQYQKYYTLFKKETEYDKWHYSDYVRLYKGKKMSELKMYKYHIGKDEIIKAYAEYIHPFNINQIQRKKMIFA